MSKAMLCSVIVTLSVLLMLVIATVGTVAVYGDGTPYNPIGPDGSTVPDCGYRYNVDPSGCYTHATDIAYDTMVALHPPATSTPNPCGTLPDDHVDYAAYSAAWPTYTACSWRVWELTAGPTYTTGPCKGAYIKYVDCNTSPIIDPCEAAASQAGAGYPNDNHCPVDLRTPRPGDVVCVDFSCAPGDVYIPPEDQP